MASARAPAPRAAHPRTQLVYLRFTPDADIRRCSECGGQTPLEILVSAPPSEITHPGAD